MVFLTFSQLLSKNQPSLSIVSPFHFFLKRWDFFPSSGGTIGMAMPCSLFLYEKDGASCPVNKNQLLSIKIKHYCWLTFSQRRERQKHGKSGEGIFTISRESGVPHITEGQTINLHHLMECPEAEQYGIHEEYLLRKLFLFTKHNSFSRFLFCGVVT